MEPHLDLWELLDQGSRALLDSLDGLDDAAAALRPGEGRWSVLECVEHVAVAEELLLSRLIAAIPAQPSRNEVRERAILERGADRTRRALAPEATRPIGRFSTLAEALSHFQEARQRTRRFLRECPADLRALTAVHPIIGPVNGYELVLILSQHPVRHAAQIREIRSETHSH